MNKPTQPPDPPTPGGVNPVSDPVQGAPLGIPDGTADSEPTGLPNSDRHKTETSPTKQ